MSGFEVLREVKQHNEQAREVEFDKLAAALGTRREGINAELWRALPDSDGEVD
ncbi:hypothetical protein [Streptomyces sp. NPDC059063]|uniref:hypothetical protein n=1 Tax=unclassified Streptomyces TaxID=2593676 RepID=UPI003678621F